MKFTSSVVFYKVVPCGNVSRIRSMNSLM